RTCRPTASTAVARGCGQRPVESALATPQTAAAHPCGVLARVARRVCKTANVGRSWLAADSRTAPPAPAVGLAPSPRRPQKNQPGDRLRRVEPGDGPAVSVACAPFNSRAYGRRVPRPRTRRGCARELSYVPC